MNYCIDCKKEISINAKRCRSCAHKGALNPIFNSKQTKESNEKRRQKLLGRISPMKGRKQTKETIQKRVKNYTGDKHYLWKGGIAKSGRNILIYMPEHSRAINKHIRLSHCVAESYLGRFLYPGEIIHHIDENPHNNLPENLYLFPSLAEHSRYHRLLYFKRIKPITKSNLS